MFIFILSSCICSEFYFGVDILGFSILKNFPGDTHV